MTLSLAQSYAEKILAWLRPHAVRLQLAGSIRRQRPECADIDIVCIPKTTEHRDLLGFVTVTENHVWQFLTEYCKERNKGNFSTLTPRIISGGEKPLTQLLIQLPKCQLDLWFADEENLITRLICRTGSKEHNAWLANRAQSRGLHWKPYVGLLPLGHTDEINPETLPLPADSETQFYAHLGLTFIDPKDRELPWIHKHLDFGIPR